MIVGALLCKNEADRYLVRALTNAAQFCDQLVVLDDGSTDNTAQICRDHGAVVLTHESQEGWFTGGERENRSQLWATATKFAGPDGWVYLFDADHELLGITPEDFRRLTQSRLVNSWAFPLYDCWDDDLHMRVDGYWQAHLHPRPWLFKAFPTKDFVPEWPDRELHVGHAPSNYPICSGVVPDSCGIRHLGYIRAEDRLAKCERYLALANRMTPFEIAHAHSITEPPTLSPIPQAASPRILAASIIRKPPVVIQALLQTLAWQRLQKGTLDIVLQPNFSPNDGYALEALEALKIIPESFQGTVRVLPNIEAPSGDYGDGERTRQWTQNAFERVAKLKDDLLQMAVQEGYEYVWLIDSDVLCDPYTLQSLLDSTDGRQIVSGVYWTNWSRPTVNDAVVQHAGPQVWLVHPYQLSGRGWTEPEFREALITRQRVQVWGLGACTLVPRSAIEKGVCFRKTMQLPGGPMAEGEDRQFCAMATRLHIEMYADAWPDIYHAYHNDETDSIPAWLEKLNRKQEAPKQGDLVSFVVRNLEVPQAPPQFIRGRLGAIDMLPQIEEALMGMTPGDSRLVRAVFPIHWPEPSLRNQTFTLSLHLLDAKPFTVPPVIDGELFVGQQSGRAIDHTTLTADQAQDVAHG